MSFEVSMASFVPTDRSSRRVIAPHVPRDRFHTLGTPLTARMEWRPSDGPDHGGRRDRFATKGLATSMATEQQAQRCPDANFLGIRSDVRADGHNVVPAGWTVWRKRSVSNVIIGECRFAVGLLCSSELAPLPRQGFRSAAR
jgi:hypothetical protein